MYSSVRELTVSFALRKDTQATSLVFITANILSKWTGPSGVWPWRLCLVWVAVS